MLWRNLLGYIRIPEQVFFSSVQPVMFILLFRYVFGGAIQITLPDGSTLEYVHFLMPGIFAQTVAFGAIGTASGLADDLGKGLIERFRSLPMSQSAVLVGRTSADFIRNIFVVFLMAGIGYLVGFRVQTTFISFLGGVSILLLFAYALGWAFATIGLLAPNAETAQLMVFPVLMPLTFASSSFVQVESMPGWLQAFANNQPVTAVVDAARALMIYGPVTTPVLKAVAWCVGILVVLAPVAVWRFKRTGVR
jgi:ABC transporter DrrB family efflux protein